MPRSPLASRGVRPADGDRCVSTDLETKIEIKIKMGIKIDKLILIKTKFYSTYIKLNTT
jgi:hypothetical protein